MFFRGEMGVEAGRRPRGCRCDAVVCDPVKDIFATTHISACSRTVV